jgi:hypothetical protein
LNKVVAKEYYRLNAGFFLVIITLSFGFMSDVEHIALAQFFISSPYILLIPILVWAIYTLKIMQFNTHQLRRAENLFLYNLALLSAGARLILLLAVITIQFLPALLYGMFLILMAVKSGLFQAISLIIPALIMFTFIATTRLFFELNHPDRESKTTGVKNFFDRHFTKSIVQFYAGWVLRREPMLLIGTKVFSGLLIFAVAKLYEAESYDWRLMAMGTILAFSGNFMVILQLHRFENSNFIIIRNLPLTLLKRWLIFLVVFISLCIPEVIVLVKYFPDGLSLIYVVMLTLLGLSLATLFYGILYMQGVMQKDFVYLTFALIMLYIVLVLFNTPLLLLVLMNFVTGFMLFKGYYYSFEISAATTSGYGN